MPDEPCASVGWFWHDEFVVKIQNKERHSSEGWGPIFFESFLYGIGYKKRGALIPWHIGLYRVKDNDIFTL